MIENIMTSKSHKFSTGKNNGITTTAKQLWKDKKDPSQPYGVCEGVDITMECSQTHKQAHEYLISLVSKNFPFNFAEVHLRNQK